MKMNTRIARGGVRWRVGASLCAGAIGLCGIAAGAAVAGSHSASQRGARAATVVRVADGALRGKTVAGVREFLGIPYAAPPVGNLRWRPPASPAKWTGVRQATKFAPHCAQPATPFGLASSSENCLYLNVYAPGGSASSAATHPVMVWIHGGGLWLGESQDYDPAKLVADGTVVVTINYRLGALGFLAHPALTDSPSGSTGAYGLMDQQAALRWVQHNIRQFGGNPRNVTIAGQSAGGLSVLAQVASQRAHGLFSRAIVESGAFALTQTPLATAERSGEAFAAKAGCANQTAACLRALPVSVIEANDRTIPTGYTPGVVDGTVLTQSIGTALASGKFNRVPILNGTVRDESRLFVGFDELTGTPTTSENYTDRITATLGVSAQLAAGIATEYPLSAYPSAAVALSAVDTDAAFACPALKLDQTASKFVPTFAYEFNDTNAPERFLKPASFPYGAPHISETQYLFNLPTAPIAGTLTPKQQQLATGMQHYWASFAANGAPSAAGNPTWPGFNARSQKILSLVPSGPQVESTFAKQHHCVFWSAG